MIFRLAHVHNSIIFCLHMRLFVAILQIIRIFQPHGVSKYLSSNGFLFFKMVLIDITDQHDSL